MEESNENIELFYDKIDGILKTAEDLVGSPYVFGSWGVLCTPQERVKRARMSEQYSAKIKKYCPVMSGKQSNCNGCKYNGLRCFDCRGLTDYILRANDVIDLYGDTATTQYNTTSNWAMRGKLTDAPDVRCYVVFRKDGSRMPHTGLYVDGNVYHAKGHAYGIVKEPISKVNFTNFGVPKNLYKEIPEMRALRKGSSGDDVRSLQEKLNKLGYGLTVDGIFGTKTVNAVMLFQAANLLTTDGVVGEQTLAALNKAVPEEPKVDVTKEILDRLEKLERKVFGDGTSQP